MKKILAVMVAVLLMVSFAGCSKTVDKKNNTDTTQTTQAATEPVNNNKVTSGDEVIGTITTPIENATQAPLNPVYTTVEEWIADNKDVVDTFCADSSVSDETVENSVTMEVSADGNVLYMTMVFVGPDVDAILENYDEYAVEEQTRFDALSDEEKLAEIIDIASEIDEAMPMPEKIVQNVCKDSANNVVASVTLGI